MMIGKQSGFDGKLNKRKGERDFSKLNYYEILGVARNASPGDIKDAFRRLAMKLHPDRKPYERSYGGHTESQWIGEAYNHLGDESKRKAYDARLDNQGLPKGGHRPDTAQPANRSGFGHTDWTSGFNFDDFVRDVKAKHPRGFQDFDMGSIGEETVEEAEDYIKRRTAERNEQDAQTIKRYQETRDQALHYYQDRIESSAKFRDENLRDATDYYQLRVKELNQEKTQVLAQMKRDLDLRLLLLHRDQAKEMSAYERKKQEREANYARRLSAEKAHFEIKTKRYLANYESAANQYKLSIKQAHAEFDKLKARIMEGNAVALQRLQDELKRRKDKIEKRSKRGKTA